MLFFVGFLTSVLGILAIARGKEYYRSTIVQKTVLEDLLGLTDEVPGYGDTGHRLAVGTTRGIEKIDSILQSPQWYAEERSITPGSITFYIMLILGMIGFLDLFGMMYVLFDMVL